MDILAFQVYVGIAIIIVFIVAYLASKVFRWIVNLLMVTVAIYFFNSKNVAEDDSELVENEKINFPFGDTLQTAIIKNSKMKYTISKSEYIKSLQNREKIVPEISYFNFSQNKYWGSIYSQTVKYDKNLNNYLINNIKKNKKLKPIDVIKWVQSIPYSLIHESSCKNALADYPRLGKKYHKNNLPDNKKCLKDVKYGYQSTVEFLYNLKGDCDTKSVFLANVLNQLGYDCIIFSSEKYKHAMLGINSMQIPGIGAYKYYKGNKYLFLESTNKGWKIGDIPPQSNNLKYWEVVEII